MNETRTQPQAIRCIPYSHSDSSPLYGYFSQASPKIHLRKKNGLCLEAFQAKPTGFLDAFAIPSLCVDALATWLISSNTVTACRRLSDSLTHLLFSVDGSTQIRLPIRHRSQRALFCAASDSAPTPGRVKARMRFFAHQQHDQARDKHGGCGKPETRFDATE